MNIGCTKMFKIKIISMRLLFFLLLYPYCNDCIYKKWFVCDKTKISTYQTRKNPELCGEDGIFFSPKFSKITLNHTFIKKCIKDLTPI